MNAPRAAAVMAYRNGGGGRGGSAGSSCSNGFTSRAEVATIKGIGSKTFQQAVGFLRVTTSASSIEPAAPAEAAAARKISTRKERVARVLDGTTELNNLNLSRSLNRNRNRHAYASFSKTKLTR